MVCDDDNAWQVRHLFRALAADLHEIITRYLIGSGNNEVFRNEGAILADLNGYSRATITWRNWQRVARSSVSPDIESVRGFSLTCLTRCVA